MIILSLGAGVQSTTLALMAAHGEIGPMPDAAIFADTGDEPAAVYEHLRWLMSPNVLPFPVHIVRGNRSLSDALKAGDDAARVPFHVGAGGISGRQCTRNFKLRPIRQETRRLLGKGERSFVPAGAVECWVGISTDEVFRCKPSGLAYIVNRHPLIEARISRRDCERWLLTHGYPIPPKSSCVYCPYKSNGQWAAMKSGEPDDFAVAVGLDEWLREPEQVKRFHGQLFVHPSRKPLAEADFDPRHANGQGDLFNHECEGLCGV